MLYNSLLCTIVQCSNSVPFDRWVCVPGAAGVSGVWRPETEQVALSHCLERRTSGIPQAPSKRGNVMYMGVLGENPSIIFMQRPVLE